jgi:hypothetical protein
MMAYEKLSNLTLHFLDTTFFDVELSTGLPHISCTIDNQVVVYSRLSEKIFAKFSEFSRSTATTPTVFTPANSNSYALRADSKSYMPYPSYQGL